MKKDDENVRDDDSSPNFSKRVDGDESDSEMQDKKSNLDSKP